MTQASNVQTQESSLLQGNAAMRRNDHAAAIQKYLDALQKLPGMEKTIASNLSMARRRYRASRNVASKPRVGVCGWELSHNAAGRVYTLAMLYETFAEVEIIGCHFPGWGREVWGPIRDTATPKHSFVVEDEATFIDQALQLVAAHPYDVVHLSKPRAPNVIFGLLYKLIWDAKVLIDIDDEELAFVGADAPIHIDDYLKQHGRLPDLKDLAGKDWTRLAVGLINEFDGVTVCNTQLQQRYGGQIIPHARDEKKFKQSPELKRKNREKYGISQDKKVVLFFGTPREHKGLLETAHALDSINDKNIIFLMVGDFSDELLKERIRKFHGCNAIFLPDQPFDDAPSIVSLADCAVLLRKNDSFISKYQTPAKMSDLLAGGVPIICAGDFDFGSSENFFLKTSEDCKDLASVISKIVVDSLLADDIRRKGEIYFKENISLDVVWPKLKNVVMDLASNPSNPGGRVDAKLNELRYLFGGNVENLFMGGNIDYGQLQSTARGAEKGALKLHGTPVVRNGRDAFMLRGLRPQANVAIVVNAPSIPSVTKALQLLKCIDYAYDIFILGDIDPELGRYCLRSTSITIVGKSDAGGNAQEFLRLIASHVFDAYEAVLWLSVDQNDIVDDDLINAEPFLKNKDWGIRAKTERVSVNEDILKIAGTVLPRLGVSVDTDAVDVPLVNSAAIWFRPLLFRGLAASLSPSELSAENAQKGFPGRLAVLLILSVLAKKSDMFIGFLAPNPVAEGKLLKLKTIAFYLPQFHPIPENDTWWGKGFTEWTNVTRGRQLFRSHYQPRVPADLGYYDLRLEETQIAQANLASEYGIHGFCFYYYWFDGKKLLNRPIEQMFESKKIDTGFCVCWANENWSRNWDGQNRHVLMEQTYSLESNIALIRELIPMMKDPRWIRYKDKPVMMVYRISIIPNWIETSNAWRDECRLAGLGEIHLCAVRFGMETLVGMPSDHGLDSYVMFPPHESARLDLIPKVKDLNKDFGGSIFDYSAVVDGDIDNFQTGYDWPVHRGAMMGWDNTARRLTAARIFHGATPYAFRRWVKGILGQEQHQRGDDESLMFINAWNEWAEGTYLEPDQRWGRSYLQAYASAVQSIPKINAEILPPGIASQPRGEGILDAVGNPDSKSLAPPVWSQGIRQHNHDWPTVMLCAHIAGHQLFGGERSLLDVVEALSEFPINLLLTLPSGNNNSYIQAICKKSLGVYAFPYPQWRDNRQAQAWLINTFSDIVATHAVDLVHANTIVLLEPLKAAARMRCIRVIHSRELISLDDPLRERLGLGVSEILSQVYERSDWIIANSRATESLFSRPGKTHYVPNAVTIEDFVMGNKFGNVIKFGIVSSNIPKKGVSDFVEVARRVASRSNRAKFVVIGPVNEQVKAWQEEISRGQRPDNLIIAGYAEQPRKAMSQINVLLNLSHFAESFGRTVAEAMAARRPVIAYDWGALSELVQHERTGILVPYRDIDGVVDAVLRMCDADQLINEMGDAGHAYVSQNFTQNNLKSMLAKSYEEILNRPMRIDGSDINSDHISSKVIGLAPVRTTIVVPVYNAPNETRDCLRSVLKHTDLKRNRLIVINDGSPDSTVESMLSEFEGISGVTILRNSKNIGYTKTINIGIRQAESDDVVLLNSDAVVTPRWLEGLRSAAYCRAKVGTVTAMSDNAGAFSFPKFNQNCPRPAHLTHDEYALLLLQSTQSCTPPEVPTGSGFCFYIRRAMMTECGLFDEEGFPRGYGEENDFCMRALKSGWVNLITPWTFVYHVRTASFKGEKTALVQAGVNVVTKRYPDYAKLVKEAFSSQEMMDLRSAASVFQPS